MSVLRKNPYQGCRVSANNFKLGGGGGKEELSGSKFSNEFNSVHVTKKH